MYVYVVGCQKHPCCADNSASANIGVYIVYYDWQKSGDLTTGGKWRKLEGTEIHKGQILSPLQLCFANQKSILSEKSTNGSRVA